MCSNFVARIRPPQHVDSDWLAHVFGALHALRRNVAFVKQVTGIQNLDTDGYLSLPVPDLAREEQKRIAEVVQASLENTLTLQREFIGLQRGLGAYREALITEAITGRLDVSKLTGSRMEESLVAARDAEPPEVLA
jgi:hypothetical protein